MKQISTILFFAACFTGLAQQPYYNSIDLNLKGQELKKELTTLITTTHKKQLSYGEVWDALKVTDLDPTNSTRVIQIYGYNKNSTTSDDAYYNSVNNNGGGTTQWNREHTYAKSLGTPNLGEAGPGADAHHLRASNVKRNSTRGSSKFANGSGTSKNVSGGWYPGDEWKGDVARMMMYMYLRYQTRCLPAGVGVGSTSQTSDGMIDLFLKWNSEDPVSQIEIQRNEYLGNSANKFAQGNRNPFIDNPYLATVIWGGPVAENKWEKLGTDDNYIEVKNTIKTYTKNNSILIASTDDTVASIQIFNSFGQLVRSYDNTRKLKTIELQNFEKGIYIIKINGATYSTNKKVIVK
ncbi:endonuclease [Algoriella sp.]|uniref:endonuclease n=2 Tax=Algoriella sp. TaxID=1872434 RepID=UPI002FCB1CE6